MVRGVFGRDWGESLWWAGPNSGRERAGRCLSGGGVGAAGPRWTC